MTGVFWKLFCQGINNGMIHNWYCLHKVGSRHARFLLNCLKKEKARNFEVQPFIFFSKRHGKRKCPYILIFTLMINSKWNKNTSSMKSFMIYAFLSFLYFWTAIWLHRNAKALKTTDHLLKVKQWAEIKFRNAALSRIHWRFPS